MQVALSIWLAGINHIAVDCRDVFKVLAVEHVSASEFPEICVALGVEFVADDPIVVGRAGGQA